MPFVFPFSLRSNAPEPPPPRWPIVGIGGSVESLDSLIDFVVASIAKRDPSNPRAAPAPSSPPPSLSAPSDSASLRSAPSIASLAPPAAAAGNGKNGDAAYVVVARGLTSAAAETLVEEIRHATGAPVTALHAEEQEDELEPGRIYVTGADPDRYPLVAEGRLRIVNARASRASLDRGTTDRGTSERPDRANTDRTDRHTTDRTDRGTPDRARLDHRPLDHFPMRPPDQGPIDHFFETLATEYGERAIAVILAGAGEDGAVGVRAIRDLGGHALAQDPDSASPLEMPESAIASGLIEEALPLDALAARVRKYAENVANGHSETGWRAPLDDPIAIATVAHDHRRRPARTPAADDERVPNPHSPRLFRDPQAWISLRDRVIKPMLLNRSPTTPFRAWVVSESASDDAYSMAMLVDEAARELELYPPVRVLASLHDGDALASARRGVFPAATIGHLPPDLRRYFVEDGYQHVVTEALRSNIVFAHHDLLFDVPFSRLDVIVCRDLLSTVNASTRSHVIQIFHRALNPGGALFVGAVDTIAVPGSMLQRFDAVDRRHRIFRAVLDQKVRRLPPLPPALPSPAPSPGDAAPTTSSSQSATPSLERSRPSAARILRQTLLDHFAPAAVLTDESLQVLYVHGGVDAFLSLVEGEPTTADLLALLSPRLVEPVRSATRRALEDRRASFEAAEPTDGGEYVLVTVVPIEGPGRSRLLSVTFTPRAQSTPAVARESASIEPSPESLEVERGGDRSRSWSTVLQAWGGAAADNQRLRAVIDDMQISSDELTASREEMQTMYEEVEEANARLLVVNAELEAQLFQLKTLSDDVVHLLDGTELAAVFLDREGRVRRFTPPIRELIPLLPSDAGRAFADFAREFEDPTLDADLARALRSSLSSEGVAKGRRNDEQWFLRRLIPCWTDRGATDGAVLTFTDISTRQRAEESLRRSNLELEDRVRQRTAVAVLQQDIAVIANNTSSMERAFAAALERLCLDEHWMAGHVYQVRAGTAEDSVWYDDVRSGRRLETRLGGMSFGPGEGLVGRVIEDGEPRFTSELDSDQRFADERERPYRVRSVAAFPILAGDRVVGVFEFFSRHTDPPGTTLLEVMRNVGTQIGRVIEREEARERVFDLAVEEQRSLGEELHDTLSQQVHGLSMLAQSMTKDLKAAGVDQGRVRALVDGLVETHKQIRVLSNGLVPVRVEAGGLAVALDEMARGWEQMHGAECVFEHEGDGELDDDRVATALYRIAREAARNAVLHGEATRVVIRLTENDGGVSLEVSDDGRGMKRVPVDGPGMGLQIMRHRAEHLGGKLEIESAPGRGTVVRCRIVSTRGQGVERQS